MRTSIPLIAVLLLSLLVPMPTATAQVRPVNDYGALGLGQMLRRLQTTGSVMMIGAHPDDEDSALLAYLARGENARTAYLSLTRGDGGQNIIGSELFEALGVIRTEELLQARKLDGAEQYFTRAYDYGFSKTLDEAKSKWPEQIVLCDVVSVIREFKPLVVISRFTGTPSDGHGQHQYAGYISPLAVQAAADPTKCGGLPWKVRKFYVEQGFGNSNAESLLRLDTGKFDPLYGRSYFEIAMEGRSQHRSQGEGRLEYRGSFYSGLRLVNGSATSGETSPFDNIDTSIAGMAKTFSSTKIDPSLAAKLVAVQEKLAVAAREFRPLDPRQTLANLLEAKKLLSDRGGMYREANREVGGEPDTALLQMIAIKDQELNAAILEAAGVQIDALSDRETAAAGEDVSIAVRSFFPAESGVSVRSVRPYGTCYSTEGGDCPGVRIETTEEPKTSAQQFRRESPNDARYFIAHISNAPLTQPYWLISPRNGDLYNFQMVSEGDFLKPFSRPPIMVEVSLEIGGIELRVQRPVENRFADPARGEIRRELNVVPAVTINPDQDLIVVPYSDRPQTRRLRVTVKNNSSMPASGSVAARNQWSSAPNPKFFDLKRKDETAGLTYEIPIPARTQPGLYGINLRSAPESNSGDFSMHLVAYPHIQTHRYYTRPNLVVRVIDLNTVPLNVGYIMGSGDEVPDAIRQMGLNVTMIDDVASADLSKFDCVVVGIRASEVRLDVIANNQKLLDFVKNGGNLIMQYQRGNWTGIAPYPANAQDRQGTAAGSISRVVDENAPVRILEPQHPVFNFPNKITDDDFKNWVQERNAYNLVTFDQNYTPLLESHDAGEQENKGGLVIAKVGKGTWTYCSYSFFRQLPAGVPGAYRLFANILSIGRTPAATK